MATWTGDMTELGIALSALAEPRKTGEFPPTNRHDGPTHSWSGRIPARRLRGANHKM
jgi:hypothetical protein